MEIKGIKHLHGPRTLIEYPNTMDVVYNNTDNYNPKRNRKMLIVFDDMISDIKTNKNFQAIIKELFIKYRKVNISLIFIRHYYFSLPKKVSLIFIHYPIMKIHSKTELQNIAINHSVDINYKDFMKIYSRCTGNHIPYFLTIDTT